ncbi:hypothetical protein [Bacillus suaedaesalsae]|uniref:Lipoprotein n=1 Tax=Bacillus suaedaesalsae TaxID=2810349 RepID=A0ABS2DHI0_9BACI|nr:hypothetical protein [Bacillus suaedaesalsae]MBM6617949.1 hypothetical protein [Bacillus suaedaesalsae]
MKKLLAFIMIMLVLTACDNSILPKSNSINPTKLTEREEVILSNTSDQAFVFDFNVENSYKKVSVWVEKYEFGKLVGKVNDIGTEVNKSGQIILSVSKLNEAALESIFTLTVSSDGGSASGWGPEKMIEMPSVVTGVNQNENISLECNEALASIIYSKQSGISSMSPELYKDVDGQIDEIAQHDVVYLLKAKFD